MGSHHSKPSALAREPLGLCNWRNHVRNDAAGGKEFPSIVTPGGAVLYGSVPLPRIPAPDFLGVDLPFLVLDNWQVRFFPITNTGMEWLTRGVSRWVRERHSKDYRTRVFEYLDRLERIVIALPAAGKMPWP
jgi:hypothetical protein